MEPEIALELAKKYIENVEKHREVCNRYRANHLEKYRQNAKQYYEKNAEKIREKQREKYKLKKMLLANNE